MHTMSHFGQRILSPSPGDGWQPAHIACPQGVDIGCCIPNEQTTHRACRGTVRGAIFGKSDALLVSEAERRLQADQPKPTDEAPSAAAIGVQLGGAIGAIV